MSGPHYFAERDQWLRWRGVGGTTISAILGVNPWQSPLHAYLNLTGLINDDHDTVATSLGRELQVHIAERWIEGSGTEDAIAQRDPCYDHPDNPRLTASLDYLLATNRPLEIKLTADRKAWKDGPPAHVEAQARWQLGLARANGIPAEQAVIVCCTVPGWRLAEHTIDHDDELWDGMVTAAQAFLDNHVEPMLPPPACALDLDHLADGAAADPKPWHAEGDAAAELEKLVADYAETGDIIRAGEKLQKDQRARLLQLMDGHTDAWLAHDTARKPLVTVRQNQRRTVCPACEHVLSDTTYPVLKVAV